VKLCLATSLIGVVLMLGSVVAMATTPHARGGRAVPVTTKAPPLPKQKRGYSLPLRKQRGRTRVEWLTKPACRRSAPSGC
jgi:hypothetical protein